MYRIFSLLFSESSAVIPRRRLWHNNSKTYNKYLPKVARTISDLVIVQNTRNAIDLSKRESEGVSQQANNDNRRGRNEEVATATPWNTLCRSNPRGQIIAPVQQQKHTPNRLPLDNPIRVEAMMTGRGTILALQQFAEVRNSSKNTPTPWTV